MELAFIQECLTHCLYPDRPLPAAPPGTDWNAVYTLLAQHRLIGPFYVLGRDNPGLWPRELQERLREGRYRALLHGDRCAQQVGAVLSALRQAGIPVIVLKGWAMIPTVYGGDYGQRLYDDIDLLVLPRDAAHAVDILGDLGYQGKVEPWPGYSQRYCHSWAFFAAPNEPAGRSLAFGIQPHWRLLRPPFHTRRMPVEQLFECAQPLQVAGVDAHRLAAEDHLVYSCGHLALHHEYDEALLRYYEIAAFILQTGLQARPGIDWGAVAARASAWRLILPVQRILARLEALWPGVVPTQALEAISRLQPTRAERLIHRWWVKNEKNSTVHVGLVWLTMPGLGNRLRYLAETACPGPRYMQQQYGPAPRGLWPLLYFRRLAVALGFAILDRRPGSMPITKRG
jgi:hypothetical protein